MNQIGLQLYTVRELLKEEPQKVFDTIKAIGYDSIQLFGSIEKAEVWAKGALAAGLSLGGILIDLEACEEQEQALFDFCKKYEIADIGISSRFEDFEKIDSYIKRVNAFAAKAKAEGFSFSYHNHGHEFIRLADGKHAMERFMAEFSEDVDFMPDTYWLHDGGYDIRRFLEETCGRVKILHLKDLKKAEKGHTFAEIGMGNLYFEGILKTALNCGISKFFVEQDICRMDPLESIKISFENTKGLLEELK